MPNTRDSCSFCTTRRAACKYAVETASPRCDEKIWTRQTASACTSGTAECRRAPNVGPQVTAGKNVRAEQYHKIREPIRDSFHNESRATKQLSRPHPRILRDRQINFPHRPIHLARRGRPI